MPISLKQAYTACLWLAERKLGIPQEEQCGEWDLTKDKTLDVSRRDIVIHLPDAYFDINSCYFGQLCGNEDYEYGGIEFVDASNFIDGHIFRFEDQQHFQPFSPFRNSPFFMQSGDEPLALGQEPSDHFPSRDLPLLTIDELTPNSCTDEEKPYLAAVAAHLTLTSKLANKELTAYGFQRAIDDIGYLKDRKAESLKQPLPDSIWNSKTIPNYSVSAIEIGLHRHDELAALVAQTKNADRIDYLTRCELWYSHIHLEKRADFENWLMERVRRAFPTPKKATFKPQGKGYLIQFGTDKPIEIKANNGVKIIHRLLKDYTSDTFKENYGYSLEMMSISDLEEEVSDYEISTHSQRKKAASIRKYIRKQHSLIFWYLDQLKQLELNSLEELQQNQTSNDTYLSTLTHNEIKSTIFKRFNNISSINQNEVECLDPQILGMLIKMEPIEFMLQRKKIRESLNIEMSEEEKSIDTTRNTINAAVKSIKKVAPHLAFYLGSAKSKSPIGIGYNNDLFYFVCSKNITWDFG
ncbi:hypothetical protein M2G44_17915 [Vibrio vulnificus]|nr:hypothetical protein [Vibrio vulnificus]